MSAPPSYDQIWETRAADGTTQTLPPPTHNASSSCSVDGNAHNTTTSAHDAIIEESVSDPVGGGKAAKKKHKQAEKKRLEAEKAEQAKQRLADYYKHIAQKRVDRGEPVVTEIPVNNRRQYQSTWNLGVIAGSMTGFEGNRMYTGLGR